MCKLVLDFPNVPIKAIHADRPISIGLEEKIVEDPHGIWSIPSLLSEALMVSVNISV